MRFRRFLVGTLAITALFLATVSVGAASVTLTPAVTQYDSHPLFKVTGLIPRAAYIVQIYDPVFAPLIPGGVAFVADADGAWATSALSPEQTDLPGIYTFEVDTVDGTLVTRGTGTVVGTNQYYVQQRLGAIDESTRVDKPSAALVPATQLPPPQPAVQPAPHVTSISPTSGPTAGGTSVTITGRGFQPGVSVVFPSSADDAAACTEVNVSTDGTQIRCKTPEQIAGTLDVIAMNPDGQSSVLPRGYTYQ